MSENEAKLEVPPQLTTNIVIRFGDGYILIGFSNGFVVVISTHMKEIGQVR